MLRNFQGLLLVGLISVPIFWQKSAGGSSESEKKTPRHATGDVTERERQGVCDARCILARFVGAADTTQLSDTLDRARELDYQELDFLLMLAPDPRDSAFPESFDSYLNAARVAIESSDFSSDLFYDPWRAVESEKSGKSAPSDSPRQEQAAAPYREHPGALLFRRDTPAPFQARPARRRELLMLLVVGEMATWGIQKSALYEALDLVQETCKAGLCPRGTKSTPFTLRVLGPSSSGATESLRIGLASWIDAKTRKDPAAFESPGWKLEIVSGSATSRDNLRILAGDLASEIAPIPVTFRATVNADDALWHFASGYLGQLGANSSDIALLTESNTDYGQDFRGQAEKAVNSRDAILNLPFPLHIAESRPEAKDGTDKDSASGESGTGTSKLPQALRDLAWSKGMRGTDSLSAHGKLTRAANELALTNILRTIASEHKRYVGILASDILDLLFLAQQVRSWFPEVVVVVFTSDLLFLHDAVPFMDGVLVVSTYPLAAWTQQASFPFSGDRLRQMFASEYAQGVYNAALALLEDKRPDDINDPRDVADYGRPFSHPCDNGIGRAVGPPLWISVISHNAFWPLEAKDGAPEEREVYTQKLVPIETESDPNDRIAAWRLPSERGLGLLAVLLAMFSLLVSFAYARGLMGSPEETNRVRVAGQLLLRSSGFPHPRMHRFGLTSVFLTLGILGLILLPFVCLEERLASLTEGTVGCAVKMATLATLVIGVGSAWAMFGASARRLPGDTPSHERDVRGHARKWSWFFSLGWYWCFGVCGVAAVVVAVLNGFSAIGIGQLNPGDGAVRLMFLYYRGRALLGGQSLPALAGILAVGYLIWIGGHLRQVRIHQSAHRLREWKMLSAGDQNPLLKRLGIETQSAAAVTQAEKILPNTAVKGLMVAFYVVVSLLLLPRVQLYEKALPLGWTTWFLPGMYVLIVGFLFWGCYSFVATWTALKDLLSVLGTHPIAAAFRRIPPQLAEVFRHPWSDEIENVWRNHCIVLFNNANALSPPPSGPSAVPAFASGTPLVRRLAAMLGKVTAGGSVPSGAGSLANLVPSLGTLQSRTLGDFMKALAPEEDRIAEALYMSIPNRPLGIALKPEEFEKLESVSTLHLIRSAVPDDAHLWNRLWEEFLALRLVALIGYVRAQIYNVIGTVSLATVPILLVTALYPFNGNRTFLMLIVTLVAAVIATTLTVFTQMNRNTLVSLIDGTTPGSITWDRSYVTGLILHGAVPLATLVSVKFPAAAHAIGSVTGVLLRASGQ